MPGSGAPACRPPLSRAHHPFPVPSGSFPQACLYPPGPAALARFRALPRHPGPPARVVSRACVLATLYGGESRSRGGACISNWSASPMKAARPACPARSARLLPTRPPTLRPPTHSPALRLLTSRPPPSVFMLLPRFMAWVLTISGAYTNKSAEVQAACRTDQSSALANSPWFRVPYPGKHCGAAWACVSAMSVREYYARVRACMHVCVITHMGACVNMYVLQPCTHATRRNAARDHARTRRPVGRADRFRLQHAHHARRRAARDDRIVGGLLRLRPDRRRADAAAGRAEPRDLLAGERARPAGF